MALKAVPKKWKATTVISFFLTSTVVVIWANIAMLNTKMTKFGSKDDSSHQHVVALQFKKSEGKPPEVAKLPKKFQVEEFQEATDKEKPHQVAGLSCDEYGGPSKEAASEMVYWSDIPTDDAFVSPFAAKSSPSNPKYLVFQPDRGGFNNIRMSMETATVLALAMGRILVMPPVQGMYLLNKDHAKNAHSFQDFYHFDSVAVEHASVNIISFEEFMKREAVTGHMKDKATGKVSYPPKNRTNWDGEERNHYVSIWPWLRNVTMNPLDWSYKTCVVAFPSDTSASGVMRMEKYFVQATSGEISTSDYNGNPTPVDGTPTDRIREILAGRNLCIYNEEKANASVFYLNGDSHSGTRLLVHFYEFLFFENYHQDLWTKRFVRDHLRYIDEIQCAAARLVNELRSKSRELGNPEGEFDSFHVRRGDFQYNDVTAVSARDIYHNVKDHLVKGSVIFFATDERDKSFFDYFKKEDFAIYFLDNFAHLIPDLNKNHFGHLDQLVASRGRTFIGASYSTFTGFINRIRGYHSQKSKSPGWRDGIIDSYYYTPPKRKDDMREYRSVAGPFWSREYPVGWRDIDADVLSIQATE